MIQLTVLYGQPQSPEAFDRHYEETHAPLARKLPRLKGYTIIRPSSLNPQEPSASYLIANLYFATMDEFQEALSSPEGQAAAGDLANFATGGATLLVGDVHVYEPLVIG